MVVGLAVFAIVAEVLRDIAVVVVVVELLGMLAAALEPLLLRQPVVVDRPVVVHPERLGATDIVKG